MSLTLQSDMKWVNFCTYNIYFIGFIKTLYHSLSKTSTAFSINKVMEQEKWSRKARKFWNCIRILPEGDIMVPKTFILCHKIGSPPESIYFVVCTSTASSNNTEAV